MFACVRRNRNRHRQDELPDQNSKGEEFVKKAEKFAGVRRNRQDELADQNSKGEEFVKKAEMRLSGCGICRYDYDVAANLYEKAGICFKLAKNWDRAGSVYIKLALCCLKLERKYRAASSYVDAANCYKKISIQDTTHSLNQAVDIYLRIGCLTTAASYCKDLGELYEREQSPEKAIEFFERAADLYQCEEATSSANQCNQKVAELAAQLEQYPKAIEIYEATAKHLINNNKYLVKGILLDAGICQLCKGDVVAITNALERYQEIDPYFSGSLECTLLSALADSMVKEDVGKFTEALHEYDSIMRLDAWKTTLLLGVKKAIKQKEEEQDDLT